MGNRIIERESDGDFQHVPPATEPVIKADSAWRLYPNPFTGEYNIANTPIPTKRAPV